MSKLRMILAALATLVLIALVAEAIVSWWDLRSQSITGRLVATDTARLHVDCRGRRSGEGTIVLEAGGGGLASDWARVQSALARSHRICSYDRAGQGWSGPFTSERTPENIAAELHQALGRAGERSPYLLVGHSRGGIFARALARSNAGDVAGLVLIDSSVDGMPEAPAPIPIEQSQLRQLSLGCALAPFGIVRMIMAGQPGSTPAVRMSASAICANHAELAQIQSGRAGPPPRQGELGEKPVIVITSTGPLRGMNNLTPDQREQVQRYRLAFQRAQAAFLRLSSCSQQTFADRSGHDVHQDQPELVVASIEQALAGSAGRCPRRVGIPVSSNGR